ncbi:RNA-directed DNA polymerase, eukaryota, reverse transcriptase zinc-binding domain protein, partial [Tanacetum coccineum]
FRSIQLIDPSDNDAASAVGDFDDIEQLIHLGLLQIPLLTKRTLCHVTNLWMALLNNFLVFLCLNVWRKQSRLWVPNDVRLMWIVVYAPQSLSNKISSWSSLLSIISNWDENLVMMGDFNEVRDASERFGLVLNERQTNIFNEFITNSSLIDISLGGHRFTWTDKWGFKMSKLDGFLIFESFYDVFPHVIGVVLEKGIHDHRPILLKDFKVDFGPTPFWFFHSWLEMDGFQDLVVHTWNHDGIVESSSFVSFKKKL